MVLLLKIFFSDKQHQSMNQIIIIKIIIIIIITIIIIIIIISQIRFNKNQEGILRDKNNYNKIDYTYLSITRKILYIQETSMS